MSHWSPSPPHSTPRHPNSASGWPDRYPQIKERDRKQFNVWNQLQRANAQGSSTHIMALCTDRPDCGGNYRPRFRSARSVNASCIMWTKTTMEMQSVARQVQWQVGEAVRKGHQCCTDCITLCSSWGPPVILIQHLVHSEDIFPENCSKIEIYGWLHWSWLFVSLGWYSRNCYVWGWLAYN